MKRILITGSGGALGQQLLKELEGSSDFYVYAVTSNPQKLKEAFLSKNIEIFSKDELLPWEKIDIVLHCAFARTKNSYDYVTSLEYCKLIFENAVKNNVSAVVNVSSQSVYGSNQNIPWNEEDKELCPQDLYGMAKISSEILLSSIVKNTNTLYTNLRLSSIIQNAKFINIFIQNTLEKKPLNIIGGTQKVSFLDIKDAANAIIDFLKIEPAKWNNVYNLGTGKQHTILEIAEIVKKIASEITNTEIKINIEKQDILLNVCMDNKKFVELTKWTPKYSLESSIKQFF